MYTATTRDIAIAVDAFVQMEAEAGISDRMFGFTFEGLLFGAFSNAEYGYPERNDAGYIVYQGTDRFPEWENEGFSTPTWFFSGFDEIVGVLQFITTYGVGTFYEG